MSMSMNRELTLLRKHSNLPRNITLEMILQRKEQFTSFHRLIHTINVFYRYEIDLYSQLLYFLVNNYVLKLQNNRITLNEVMTIVMVDIRKIINDERLSDYIFMCNMNNLRPSSIFRSVEILIDNIGKFERSVFTSKVVSEGLSALGTHIEIEQMFAHLPSYSFNIIYEDLIGAAIDRDNVVLLDYLFKRYKDRKLIKNVKVNGFLCIDYASFKGRLRCLKYLHKSGGSSAWGQWTCINAARNGHLECLKYILDNGYPVIDNVCTFAAKYGHLECLKYIHLKGGSKVWNELTCLAAAEGGHLDCLRYAHDNGCPWDRRVCIEAFKNDNLDCLQYVREHGLNC